MCRKLSVRCRKWRARESLLFLPGFSPLQTITYWNLGMHLMYIQQSFVFFQTLLLLLFMVRSQFPISLLRLLSLPPAIFRGRQQ